MKNQTRKDLYIMMGLPGAGKSYWLQENAIGFNSRIISRDDIRFYMLKEGDDYFKHERKVFNKFVKLIKEALNDDYFTKVYADATHINTKSRMKLLNKLNLDNVDVHVIYIVAPVDVCIKRSEARPGRSRVSREVIKDFVNRLEPPTNDKFDYCEIKVVMRGEDNDIFNK